MATISSTGIGSGLDVKNIVSQLVALEKKPLKTLELKATTVKSQVSALGDIKSQISDLTEVAKRISKSTAWSARNATSGNPTAANISVTNTAAATTFTLDVDALATKQSVSSPTLSVGGLVGPGTMTIRLGTWSSGPTFTPASTSSDVSITASATDTVATLAAKINAANAGVVATTFFDGTNARLQLTSKDTGEAAGFRVQVNDTGDSVNNDNAGLSRFAYDPQTGAFGMASAGIPVQEGKDAKARINGLAVTSKTNTLSDNLPGVTLELKAVTTSSVTMTVKEDVTVAVKNINDFVEKYNKLNKTLADLTKYDEKTKTASLFQADSSIIGLQSVLRNMLSSISSGSTYQRLTDIGVERQLDGSLNVNTAKLSTAANNGNELQKLFTTDNSNPQTNGFALKFATLGDGLLGSKGAVTNKEKALQTALNQNAADQNKVNDRAAAVEARLNKTYTALDVKVSKLNSLNDYVSQQVKKWNQPTN